MSELDHLRGTSDRRLQDYLQRVVGVHGRTAITTVRRFASWAELPFEDQLPKPDPLPSGPVVLIGMRDTILGLPGPEAFIALKGDQDRMVIAAQLAESLINARGAPNK